MVLQFCIKSVMIMRLVDVPYFGAVTSLSLY